MADKAKLKELKDSYEARKQELVDEFLSLAWVQHILAPLEQEIALLDGELNPKKKDEK